MRRAALERRVRILEGRFSTLDNSVTGDFALADARTETDLAVEYSQRVLRTVWWGSATVAVGSIFLALLTYVRT
ncbi:MAG TPA: hypothetical protein VJS45_07115 [Acidimicrobiia bacterium]|nr:hypothetical protein [Acidimicrobiia bacterium]